VEILNSICFVDAQNGWAVGSMIMHTMDGGVSWEVQDSLEYFSLNDVYFVDAFNGWAVGSQNILHTSDGGITWEFPESSFSDRNSIYFTDLLNGWVAGENGILNTTDGGIHWEQQCYSPFSGYGIGFHDIYFTGSDEGWAVGPYSMILHTTNGGLTAIDNPDKPVMTNTLKLIVYPNPFSNSTTIEYDLEESAKVSLMIFNHLGQQVEVLVNEEQARGTHQVQWDAGDLLAGVYYCLLKTGKHLITEKIIKMK
jgi:photosystem II stability/assembly factor-like uncharacterized protein